ncbi:MAG: O-antigen ligase family protein, partial [Desulfurivibrionaceae bacterium]
LWTDDLSWGLTQTKKQWKLLLFLPLLTITRREHYKYYLTSFLAAMTLSAFLSFLLWQELIHFKGVTPQFPIPFNSHISYNPLLALALYLLYHVIIFAPRPPAKQLAFLVPAALIMTGSMFITTGRTGQAAFFILIILLTLQYFRKRIAFGLVAILIMLPVLLITAYNTGPGFRMRVNDTVANLKEYRSKPDKSIPQRLTFAANSLHIAADSIWFGVGTGDFPNEYKKINAAHSPSFKYTDDPHNHYLLVLTQFGVVGLLVFLSIFIIQIRQTFSINNGLHHFRVALPVFYLTIMAAGTYLLGHELSLSFAITSSILNKPE